MMNKTGWQLVALGAAIIEEAGIIGCAVAALAWSAPWWGLCIGHGIGAVLVVLGLILWAKFGAI
ncbi:MAG: hypothetical protein PHV85_00075 [Desulfovibrionaceae bacterium]|nr:hypothetical protein [Desulfovibrionaceae bacterium]